VKMNYAKLRFQNVTTVTVTTVTTVTVITGTVAITYVHMNLQI
jgi:hypothetical protein